MYKKTIGLISTMAPDDTWAAEVVMRVSERHNFLKNKLGQMGYEVLDEGTLHRSVSEMTDAARKLRGRGIRALVIFVGTWTYANASAYAAMEADTPVIVWGDATPGSVGLVGSAIVMGGMAEMGVRANLVYGPLDDASTYARAKMLLDAACAAMSLRGTTLGVGGGRCMGMLTAVCDPIEVKRKFGVEIEAFEQMVLIERAEEVDSERVEHFKIWMEHTFGKIVAKPEAIERQIRLYLAIKDFAAEKRYDLLALKCLPEMPACYTSYCLAHAILGDACDDLGAKDRFVLACETDLNAALTMQLLKNLVPESPVLFADLTEYNFDLDLLTLCNCGSQPTDFAVDKKDVIWEREGVPEHTWKYGGACPQHVAKQGNVTMARLGRANGAYEMLIVPAVAVEQPREKLRETVWERPHVFIKLLGDRNDFFSKIRSNHIHMVYGNYVDELKEICDILGIVPVMG